MKNVTNEILGNRTVVRVVAEMASDDAEYGRTFVQFYTGSQTELWELDNGGYPVDGVIEEMEERFNTKRAGSWYVQTLRTERVASNAPTRRRRRYQRPVA